jgi:hypothetical protein
MDNFLSFELHPPMNNTGGDPKHKKYTSNGKNKSQLQIDVFPHYDF